MVAAGMLYLPLYFKYYSLLQVRPNTFYRDMALGFSQFGSREGYDL